MGQQEQYYTTKQVLLIAISEMCEKKPALVKDILEAFPDLNAEDAIATLSELRQEGRVFMWRNQISAHPFK